MGGEQQHGRNNIQSGSRFFIAYFWGSRAWSDFFKVGGLYSIWAWHIEFWDSMNFEVRQSIFFICFQQKATQSSLRETLSSNTREASVSVCTCLSFWGKVFSPRPDELGIAGAWVRKKWWENFRSLSGKHTAPAWHGLWCGWAEFIENYLYVWVDSKVRVLINLLINNFQVILIVTIKSINLLSIYFFRKLSNLVKFFEHHFLQYLN